MFSRTFDDAPVLPDSVRRGVAGKRIFDMILAALALLALAPALLLVALAIRLVDNGPVLFRQRRLGLEGRSFEIYKFRTMYAARCDASGTAQTLAGDGRVTPIGRWLRRTSVDELPQLLNVLLGDMSLVGPRPHVEGMRAAGMPYDMLVPHYARRLAVKPGITGWAQANGLRGPTDDAALARARIEHDLAYIDRASFRFDLAILWLTLRREFFTGHGV